MARYYPVSRISVVYPEFAECQAECARENAVKPWLHHRPLPARFIAKDGKPGYIVVAARNEDVPLPPHIKSYTVVRER